MLKRKVASLEVIKKKEKRIGQANVITLEEEVESLMVSITTTDHRLGVTEVSRSIEQDSVGEAECSCSCGFLSFVLKRRSTMKQRDSESHIRVSSRYKKWRVWSGYMEGRFSRVSEQHALYMATLIYYKEYLHACICINAYMNKDK